MVGQDRKRMVDGWERTGMLGSANSSTCALELAEPRMVEKSREGGRWLGRIRKPHSSTQACSNLQNQRGGWLDKSQKPQVC